MSSSFHEVRFPVDLSFGFSGGPVFDVDIISTKAKLEQRNANSSYPRATYTAPYNSKSFEAYQAILAFYYARRGKTYGFRYKDWKDFFASNQLIGRYDGTDNTFQLVKTYGDAGGSYVRKIRKPVADTVTVYVDGVPNTAATCDYTTGIVTMHGLTGTAEKPNIITADFEFDVPVRFDNDFPTVATDDASSTSRISVNTITFLELINE